MPTSDYNVVWKSPSPDRTGTMPLGNGHFAANVRARPDGAVELLLSAPDANDINGILLKLGRLLITLDPPPRADVGFTQTLSLEDATIQIAHADDVTVHLWFDEQTTAAVVNISSSVPRRVLVSLDWYRSSARTITTQTGDLFKNLEGKDPFPTVIDADHVVEIDERTMAWCHHNTAHDPDPYEVNMRLQGLDGLLDAVPHPLRGRVFGCAVEGDDMRRDGTSLVSTSALKDRNVRIHYLHSDCNDPSEWGRRILDQAIAFRNAMPDTGDRVEHFREFWNRSFIDISSPDPIENNYCKSISRAYALQRHMNACAGRGPIKHNGSLFSVGRGDDPDFRRWGAGWWFQNQRLIYWPMLASGDFELLGPWLDMLVFQLPLQTHRTRVHFGHDGAHYPETTMPWGAEISSHYGWTPFADREHPYAECSYVSHYYSGGIELSVILLEFYLYTRSERVLNNCLLPVVREVLTFYGQHFKVDQTGRRRFEPAQSLETFHTAANPMPEIAGLRYLLEQLKQIPEHLHEPAWETLRRELPPLPTRKSAWGDVLAPAQTYSVKRNTENPELYAIFPYRLLGAGKPGLELARRSFAARLHASHTCWSQDCIQLALLGLTEQAKSNLIQRASAKCHSDSRFPAFWNNFNDWSPDIDHGGVLQLALQYMLMQTDGRFIILLPTWPKEWDVHFKLLAPFNTTVEVVYRAGRIESLVVTPPERAMEVVLPE
jgi:alpha-L-fucosidase 2